MSGVSSAASGTPSQGPSPEDRRAHLGYLQATITRMAAASTAAKGWLLPVVTAAYGYGLVKHSGVVLLGIGAAMLFGFLDAHYLTQEQKFRDLYAKVAKGDQADAVAPFDMNTSTLSPPPPAPGGPGWSHGVQNVLRSWVPGRKAAVSWSIAPFYGFIILAGVVLYFVAR